MELIFPTIEHKQAALDYRQEHFACGEMEIHGDGGLDGAESYEDWLIKLDGDRIRDDGNYVPGATYFGIIDSKIVGAINIRYKLNDYLLKIGGHIGYGVRPSARRNGYASQMLALALDKCRTVGITKILITCDKYNLGSAKTIIKNGGILENEVTEDNGNIVQRYWINL